MRAIYALEHRAGGCDENERGALLQALKIDFQHGLEVLLQWRNYTIRNLRLEKYAVSNSELGL